MHTARATDVEEIRAHVDRLFHAYFVGNISSIREGHTADWLGFQIPSRSLVQGIDQYMDAAERVLANFKGIRCEMLEFEVKFVGEVALVFYIAREWLQADGENTKTIILRSLDVYRKDAGSWNQCASNIIALPDE